MNWLKRKSYPEFWETYTSYFSKPQNQDIERVRFVVFDTETTGLDIKNDRILSIGCIAITALKIKVSDQMEVYLRQELFNVETVKIHGLLKEGKRHKIEEYEAIKQFLEYTKNAVLVAHHTAFDLGMINQALQRLNLPKLKNKVLDTGHLFQKTERDTSKRLHSLDDLANRFNIPMHDRHTASGDAYITALLFLKLIAKLNINSNLTLRNLERPVKRIGLL